MRERRRTWLFLLLFTLFLYPLLLMGSSRFGSAIGLSRDVNASRALARALSYAADPRLPVEPGNDGQLATTALDANLVALQLGDSGRGPAGSLQPAGDGPGPMPTPSDGPAPTANAGGGPPASPPTESPSPSPPPVQPSPSPTLLPSPSPTPGCSPPTGSGTFDGRVIDAQNNKKVSGATLRLFWDLCLVATIVTGPSGKFAIPGLAANTTYTYIVTAPTFLPGAGAFTTDGSGNQSQDPKLP